MIPIRKDTTFGLPGEKVVVGLRDGLIYTWKLRDDVLAYYYNRDDEVAVGLSRYEPGYEDYSMRGIGAHTRIARRPLRTPLTNVLELVAMAEYLLENRELCEGPA